MYCEMGLGFDVCGVKIVVVVWCDGAHRGSAQLCAVEPAMVPMMIVLGSGTRLFVVVVCAAVRTSRCHLTDT